MHRLIWYVVSHTRCYVTRHVIKILYWVQSRLLSCLRLVSIPFIHALVWKICCHFCNFAAISKIVLEVLFVFTFCFPRQLQLAEILLLQRPLQSLHYLQGLALDMIFLGIKRGHFWNSVSKFLELTQNFYYDRIFCERQINACQPVRHKLFIPALLHYIY